MQVSTIEARLTSAQALRRIEDRVANDSQQGVHVDGLRTRRTRRFRPADAVIERCPARLESHGPPICEPETRAPRTIAATRAEQRG